jgi:5'-nucleotidase
MKILLCNDDGIEAKGLKVLADTLKSSADLFIVAPDTERSAVGHAITIIDPLKVKEHFHNDELFGYAVSGTPADCVKLALCSLMDEKPDLIISGINQGANLGTDIIYSGTVSAATEGTLLGIPSVAVSVNSYERTARFDTAAAVICELLDFLPDFSMPEGTLLNVNVPNIPRQDIGGYRITSQGKSKYVEDYVQRIDPRGNVYYWIDGSLVDIEEKDHADYRAIQDNCVSITPIHFDVTNYDYMHSIKSRIETKLNT